jgi:hypothetical protein
LSEDNRIYVRFFYGENDVREVFATYPLESGTVKQNMPSAAILKLDELPCEFLQPPSNDKDGGVLALLCAKKKRRSLFHK